MVSKMIGKIFITRTGYDPQLGRHIKDPYLGDTPSIGACRPDFRKKLERGDHLFVISGRVPDANQFVMGGFEIDKKMNAVDAYAAYPEQRLRALENGELAGNIIVDDCGHQHVLDDHKNFDRRIENYIIGRNPIALKSDDEIQRGRSETMDALQEILKRKGTTPWHVVTHFGRTLDEKQIEQLRHWLNGLKDKAA